MAETIKFKTESKKILELMINSIYTNKDVFLRELISNASDAIDKYHYLSLTGKDLPMKNDYEINIEIDKKHRLLKISDNGIGMTHDELIDSLGTIAKSGSKDFMEKIAKLKNEEVKDIDIIGQFGVGFYSAFMVASEIEVNTRSLLDSKGYKFDSKGEDDYTIEEIDKEDSGTEVILHLRKKTDEFDYDKYLEEWQIKDLVKQYSDYIRYPIKMETTKREKTPDSTDEDPKYEDVKSIETLNSMMPIWKKNKNDVTDAEYNEFYHNKFYDYKDPAMHMLVNIEGKLEYTALLYIPSAAPYDLYSEKYEKGLQLYSKGVFIMDKCKELIPDYLKFVKGLVDSSDLDLNISREMLQKSKVLHEIEENLEKKIVAKLESLKKDDFDKYVEFFKNFGLHLKFGIYESYGLKKDLLKDLIIYSSINEEKMIGFKEYVEKMPKDQEYIYYASGKTKEAILAMPQMDLVKKHGYDVLILNDNVDEFLMNILMDYDGKKFKSINQGDLDILDKDEAKKIEELNETKKPFLEAMKNALASKVSDVRLSKRLTDSACCLVSSDGISFEMEKVLAENPAGSDAKAEKILELNPNHDLFKALEKLYYDSPLEINEYADLLYDQALLMEGFNLDNPVEFSNKMTNLMIKALK